MANDRDARVRQRAYELWEKAGRPDGKHEEHWHQASGEIPDVDSGAVGMTTPMPPAGTAKRGKVMAADVAPSLVKRRK